LPQKIFIFAVNDVVFCLLLSFFTWCFPLFLVFVYCPHFLHGVSAFRFLAFCICFCYLITYIEHNSTNVVYFLPGCHGKHFTHRSNQKKLAFQKLVIKDFLVMAKLTSKNIFLTH
jgi:hypothetical protein